MPDPQNADGRPHLAYFIADEERGGVSFVWSMEPGEPIEVCFGGYGEPMTYKIDLDEESHKNFLAYTRGGRDLMQMYKTICDNFYIEAIELKMQNKETRPFRLTEKD